jgi:DNA gyrase subunit A
MAKNKNSIEDFFENDNDNKVINAEDMLHKNMKVYGLDVLEDRALADYRDGLKPAQRRLMWTARDLKATWENKTVKSARITGDCMGKYHPHGTAYGSLETLATCEYPLIYGQGNWRKFD